MSGARLGAGLVLLCALLCGLAYAPLRSSRFIQDDHPLVQLNPVVHRGDPVEIFSTDLWAGVGGGDTSLYRPVTLLSYVLERGPDDRVDPQRAHVINILLHLAAALLLLPLAIRVGAGIRSGVVAAVLFTIHPIHLAAVAPITGRSEILALAFSLAALLCQLGSRTARNASSKPRPLPAAGPWLAGLFVFLALGSKEVAIATPVLLVLLDLLFRRTVTERPRLERLAGIAPLLFATGVHLALRAFALGRVFAAQNPPISDNFLTGVQGIESVATRLALAGRYLVHLLYPADLSADYSGNVIPIENSLLAPFPLLGLLTLAGFGLLAALPWIRRPGPNRSGIVSALSCAALLFLVPYLVIGNLIVLVGVIYAERLIYFPSAGFCLLLGMAFELAWHAGSRLPGRGPGLARGLLVTLSAAAVAAGVWQTHRQSKHWRNEETLFTASLRSTPDSPRAHFTLGKILAGRGEDEAALRRFERTVELWSSFSAAWYEIGMIQIRRGDLVRAADAFRRTVEINPAHTGAQLNLGIALHRLQRFDEAEQQLRETLARFPGMTTARAELAHLLLGTGRPEEAAKHYRQAIREGREDLRQALATAELRGISDRR